MLVQKVTYEYGNYTCHSLMTATFFFFVFVSSDFDNALLVCNSLHLKLQVTLLLDVK